uniref:Uncharacterized protein n=1 Tax=Anguilla anguilla TaxID=7936 RepID=A0A0E9VDW2_ANGAN
MVMPEVQAKALEALSFELFLN